MTDKRCLQKGHVFHTVWVHTGHIPLDLFAAIAGCCGFHSWHALYMFVESFQGQYKDGTNGTHDFRMVSASFLILRVVIIATFLNRICNSWNSSYQIVLFFSIASCMCSTTRPYKFNFMNNKWREGYLLPTWVRKITCRRFDWMLQSLSGRKWRVRTKVAIYSHALLRIHVIGGQRSVRIAPPSLPPHHSGPATREFQSSISVEALLWGCHLDVQGLLHQQLLSSAMVQHRGLLPVDRMVIPPRYSLSSPGLKRFPFTSP